MRRVFEQKGHTITSANCSGPCPHEMHDFGGSRQRQRDANAQRPLIVSRNGLISEMLTVPVERPNRLEPVQHIEIAGIPMKGGADRQLHAVYDNRQLATDRACPLQPVGNQIYREHLTVPLRPTQHLRSYLHKIEQTWSIEVGRECRDVRKPDTQDFGASRMLGRCRTGRGRDGKHYLAVTLYQWIWCSFRIVGTPSDAACRTALAAYAGDSLGEAGRNLFCF